MRKLAGEAIIFALLGLLIGTIGIFVKLDMDDRAAAKEEAARGVHARAVHATVVMLELDFSKSRPLEAPRPPFDPNVPIQSLVPLRNGTVLLVRQCSMADPAEPILRSAQGIDDSTRARLWDQFHQAKNEDDLANRLQNANISQSLKADLWEAKRATSPRHAPLFDMSKAQPIQGVPAGVTLELAEADKNCRNFSDPFAKFGGRGDPLVSVPLGNADQVAIEKDYWTAYNKSRSYAGSAVGSLLGGLRGFPVGLGLWVFYRLVRFAVKG